MFGGIAILRVATGCVKLEAQFLGEAHQVGGIATLLVGDTENGQFFVVVLFIQTHGDTTVFLSMAVAVIRIKMVAKDAFYLQQG